MRGLCNRVDDHGLEMATVVAAATFAATGPALWQAALLLPVFVALAIVDRRLRRL